MDSLSIYAAAERYHEEQTPLVVLAGKEYGTGSSRDWAAKGTLLLGVKAVLTESFERIHRSNLVGMGVLPLNFLPEESVSSLGLTGFESFEINGLDDLFKSKSRNDSSLKTVSVVAESDEGKKTEFKARVRLDTPKELEYYQHGGILHYVLRQMVSA